MYLKKNTYFFIIAGHVDCLMTMSNNI